MEVDPTRMCELLVGLPAVRVLGIVDDPGEPLEMHIETRIELRDAKAVAALTGPRIDRWWCSSTCQLYTHADPALALEWVTRLGHDLQDADCPPEIRRLGGLSPVGATRSRPGTRLM